MKRLSYISVILVSVFLIAFLSACGKAADTTENEGEESSGATVLKVAFNQPENHPQFKAMEEFGEKLKERTDGKYEVEISPNELLGAQRETIELVQSGTIAMSIVGGSLMENFNEDFVVFNLPYVFDSKEHQKSVINNEDIVGDLYHSVEDQGMIVLGAFHGGVRNVYNSKSPIETPEDLAGMKIRVMESDTNVQMMEKMGGVGTPMGQGEVYTAIQSGVLDGAENNELVYNDLKHVEVAPYYSYTQHVMLPDYLLINADLFKGMSEEHQAIFREELANAIDLEYDLFEEDVDQAKKAAEEAGAQFNEVDVKVFQDAVRPLIEEKLTSEKAKEIYEKMQKLE